MLRISKRKPNYLTCSYDVEVHTQGILRVSGRRWVDLSVRVEKEGVVDREILIYRTVVEDARKYLKISEQDKVSSHSWSC